VYPEGYTESSEEESEDDAPAPPRFVEGEVISDSAESDEDSDEGSDTENQPPVDDLTTTFRRRDITPAVIQIIIRQRSEIFPYINGRQHVNENKLIDAYDDIRRILIRTPTVLGETNYSRIVTERPPIGSDFTYRGGYKTPEGIIICRTLRNKVITLQEEFASEARLQRARAALVRRQDMPAFIEPLIKGKYINPGAGTRFYRLPTPAPSQSETIPIHEQIESSYRRLRIQPRDAGN
jgi:hypothetical protein